MSGARRVDQEMARAAATILPSNITSDLRTRYRQLPVRLRTTGLAATYAFLLAKGGGDDEDDQLARAYRRVADGLRRHFTEHPLPGLTDARTNLEFLRALADLPAPTYLRASAEAEALAGWLSRLADAQFREAARSSPGEAT